MEHTKHLWRAVLLILSFGIVFAIGTRLLVPKSFGDEGYYRADSRQEIMALPVIHAANRQACGECHAEQQTMHDKGVHAGVNCEVCHAPWSAHVKKGADGKWAKFEDMPKLPSWSLCRHCHLKLEARPDVIKQIVPSAHLEDQAGLEKGQRVPDDFNCTTCHPPHDPKPQ